MAPLPAVQLQPARTFTSTGVDYAGPYNIRVSKGRGQKPYKGYVAILYAWSPVQYTSKLFQTKSLMRLFQRSGGLSAIEDHVNEYIGTMAPPSIELAMRFTSSSVYPIPQKSSRIFKRIRMKIYSFPRALILVNSGNPR